MFKILELKGAVSLAAEVGRRYFTREDVLVALKEASEDLQNIGIQSRRKLSVGAGCRRPEKMLAIECRLKFIVN
jgi:hypothetical protein